MGVCGYGGRAAAIDLPAPIPNYCQASWHTAMTEPKVARGNAGRACDMSTTPLQR